jgi:hypothetical protein
MASRSARSVALILLLGAAACSPGAEEPPPPLDVAAMPPIRLGVQAIDVESRAQYPANMNFIARQRSERLAQDAQAFLRSRLQAAGGTEFARATVEEASIVERARPTQGGVLSTEPTWEMVGVLGTKVAVLDGLGIEDGYASSRVEITRSLSPRTSVEGKDNFTRALINDLVEANGRELEQSIAQNLAARRAP